MNEWTIAIRISSMTGSHEPLEEAFNDALPEIAIRLIAEGKFILRHRGMRCHMNFAEFDFAARRITLQGESCNETPGASR